MGKKLSIDGTVFVGSEDIDESNPYTLEEVPSNGGLLVDWGNEDTVILTGTSATIKQSNSVEVSYTRGGSPRVRVYSMPVGATVATLVSTSFPRRSYMFTNCTQNANRAVNVVYLQYNNGDSRPIYASGSAVNEPYVSGSDHPWEGITANSCYTSNGNWQQTTRMDRTLVGNTQFASFSNFSTDRYFTITRVTSDTGDVTERETPDEPDITLLGNDCNLVVNYNDGSTFDYGVVPCDAEIFLLDDCCDYSAMAIKADQAINLLLNIKNG